jgi:uncharacterized membrane protein
MDAAEKPMAVSEGNEGLSKQRIEALADGIFAFAMTLLILDVKIPKLSEPLVNEDFLARTLLDQWPKLLSFAMSFMILSLFWIAHHGYSHFVKRSNRYFLWSNLVFLLVVVFVPFSADLLGSYPRHRIPAIVYGCNIMALGLTLHWQWSYATSGHRLVGSDLEPELIRRGKRRILWGIIANICGILLAFVNPIYSLAQYVLFPIVYILPSQIDRHWTHSHG